MLVRLGVGEAAEEAEGWTRKQTNKHVSILLVLQVNMKLLVSSSKCMTHTSIDQQVVHSLLCTDNNEGSHCKRCGVSCMLCHGNTV